MDKTAANLSPARGAVRRLLKDKGAVACLVFLLLVIVLSICAPAIAPYDPDAMDVLAKLQPMGSEHLLGTDNLGRDTLSRVLYGGRVSLLVGCCAMLVSVALGLLVGIVAGYTGGAVDAVLMRIVDIFLSIPSLLFIIVIYAFLPRSLTTLILVLAMFSWTQVARVVRAQVMTLKERDFVIAAKTLGASDLSIVVRHLIPHLMPQIVVAASLSVAQAILDESALSFLGYGVQLPMSSWGSMLQTAQQFILYSPIMAAAPGVMILATVLCFNVLGDRLQQALDPKSNGREA